MDFVFQWTFHFKDFAKQLSAGLIFCAIKAYEVFLSVTKPLKIKML